MKVRLVKKLADRVDGVDLRGRQVGEVVDLRPIDATLLVAERWAIPERREHSAPTSYRRRADD